MPTRKQMDLMAATIGRKAPETSGLPPDDDLPLECWQALLDNPRADGTDPWPGLSRKRASTIALAVELKQYARKLRRQMEADDKGRAH